MTTILGKFSRTHCPGLVISGLSFLLLGTQALYADDPVNVSKVEDCRAIEARAERLLCYDTVVDGGIFNEQQLKQAQTESFGSKSLKDKPEEAISVDELTVTIVRIQKDGGGFLYFETSDGQVWKQKSAKHFPTNVPFEAVIESGFMGSFFLRDVNQNRSTRVSRVR